jgi:NAD(P)-dependent dehydrogenase (short-subunit alcohol dehydrogenase family)
MQIGKDTPAVVTGGASGLGKATAAALARAGAPVTILDLDAETGEATAEAIGARFIRTDVTDPESIAAALSAAAEANGAPRIHVNCAGIGPASKTVSRGAPHDPALFEKVIRVNLLGSFWAASQSAALMSALDPVNEDGERGVIVHTASVAAFEGQIGQVAYATSKGGIVGMTLPMARDLADKGIRVMTIAPGIFLTPLLAGLPQEVQVSLGQQVPFPRRLGDPAEFAELALEIVRNPMLNGSVIRLDGAIRMAPR